MTHADDFPIVIRRTKDGFVAEAASLGLARSGPNVTALEADMRTAVSDILAVCDRHGARIDSPPNSDAARSPLSPYRRTIFAAMAVVLVVVVVSLPAVFIYQKMNSLLSSARQFNAVDMQKLVGSGVKETADALEKITPERRDQLTRDFGRIAHALEPYAAQLRPLLVSSPPIVKPSPGESRP